MSDTDDYGDFDDELLEVATQVERAASAFLPSPRPQKRRRLAGHVSDHDNESDSDIPIIRKPVQKVRRQSRVVAESEEGEDAFDPAPLATSIHVRVKNKPQKEAKNRSDREKTPNKAPRAPKTTPRRRKGSATQSSTELDLAQSTSATSISSAGKRKRARKPKGKENAPDAESPTKKAPKKPKHRIHIPVKAINLDDIYATQLPDSDSSPETLRGPVWQKSRNPTPTSAGVGELLAGKPSSATSIAGQMPGNVRGHTAQLQMAAPESIATTSGKNTSAASRVSSASIGGVESPKLPVNTAQTAAFDAALELADIASDAFDSSSSPQKQDDIIFLSSQVSPARRLPAPQTGFRQTTLFGTVGDKEPFPASQVKKRYNFTASQKPEPPTHHKLDREAMKTWVYPTNLGTIRDYQFNIVARGLFNNLLVALPTGLGKTFIAATIMLNWFRWTTDAQIVFVAPTKPLVSQQVEACFGIAGIPRSQTTMLTGGISPGLRAEEWLTKRVFFMTPQTIMNDLKTGICDPKKIVLLVVDEAHRATGAYAYVEVVTFIRRFNECFRVLALTATPGADVESVQKVIDGLDISRVEIRTEQSLDIRNYVHSRKIETHVFQNSDEMEMCMSLYCQAVQPVLNQLNGQNAFWITNPLEITPYGCVMARQKWMRDAGRNASFGVKGMVNSIFSILGSLSHSMELLKYHGLGPFYQGLVGFRTAADQKNSKYKKMILDSEQFKKLMARLHVWVNNDNFIGHPKLDFLQEAILEHFVNAGEGRGPEGAPPSSTRIMVFAHFRDSADEIVRVLKRNSPMIRPHVFVGQAASKNSEGMDQKTQLDVIQKFKNGVYNTLIATSIGEEGLDIGEVDLIICYDSKASPIRMLQRMGRTGRKRAGKIILLQMKGKEETDAIRAKDNYEKMQELIANGSRFAFHEERSRRILPKDIQPVVDKRHVEIPFENSQKELPEPKKGRGRAPKRPPKKFHMPDNVRTGFVQASRMGDDDAEEQVPTRRATRKVEKKYPSEEPVVLKALEEVLLNDLEMKDLERRYQTVIDDDDMPTISALNFSAHPARQRTMARTAAFRRPGRLTSSIVDMLRRMHRVDEDQVEEFKNNLDHADLGASVVSGDFVISDASKTEDRSQALRPEPPSLPAKPRGRPPKTPARPKSRPIARPQPFRISDLVEEGASSSPPPTDPRMRIPSQAETLGSDTSGSEPEQEEFDSELAAFVADDDEVLGEFSSSLPNIDSVNGSFRIPTVTKGIAKVQTRTPMFYTSQQVASSDEDEELPDLSTLVGKRKPEVIEDDDDDDNDVPVVRQRKRVRRIVDDDSDE
ncbi:P-loop containing nucleoside triphosphate hydrolase protein [Lophium mytilinum]|uniref:ATP-dependent DNA helicase n=1 Tax=Lophium mytilinum TaxID=390894 RepID=A0A6A6R168_9PEZI|nr:P-loop containing nucleoside triphosphate hydrolase protein [Lophium mytilinum]